MSTDHRSIQKARNAAMNRRNGWMFGAGSLLLLLGGIFSNSVQEILPVTDMQLGLFYALPLALIATLGLMGLLMSRER